MARGDKKDAYLVRDMDPLHSIMNYVLGSRTENEAVCKIEIEMTALEQYLSDKNKDCTDKRIRYTFFHAVLAAISRTTKERKVMNYFIRNGRFYERKEISFAYIAKKNKADGASESLIIQTYKKDSEVSPIQQMHDKTCKEVSELRNSTEGKSDSDKMIEKFLKMPSFILKIVFALIRRWDRKGNMPMFLQKIIPYYTTYFVSNLGSIGINADYHHITNFGTGSVFVIIGKKERKPVFYEDGKTWEMKDFLPISVTLDERLADGVYFANTLKMIKALLLKPELLDLPANAEIDFEQLYKEVYGE